ncbi:hypothetical protein [Streptomyces sp. CA-253872]|uniref:hypothetical protein n=1 Tax=Streptomyces sp. CA-253872 TaxID=3240067 RepID=UPI003D8DD9F6
MTATAFAGSGDLQDARAEPGDDPAFDTGARERVRVSRERYEEVRAAGRRGSPAPRHAPRGERHAGARAGRAERGRPGGADG